MLPGADIAKAGTVDEEDKEPGSVEKDPVIKDFYIVRPDLTLEEEAPGGWYYWEKDSIAWRLKWGEVVGGFWSDHAGLLIEEVVKPGQKVYFEESEIGKGLKELYDKQVLEQGPPYFESKDCLVIGEDIDNEGNQLKDDMVVREGIYLYKDSEGDMQKTLIIDGKLQAKDLKEGKEICHVSSDRIKKKATAEAIPEEEEDKLCFTIKEPGWEGEPKYDVEDGTYTYIDENGEEQITSVMDGVPFHRDIAPGTKLCQVSLTDIKIDEKEEADEEIIQYKCFTVKQHTRGMWWWKEEYDHTYNVKDGVYRGTHPDDPKGEQYTAELKDGKIISEIPPEDTTLCLGMKAKTAEVDEDGKAPGLKPEDICWTIAEPDNTRVDLTITPEGKVIGPDEKVVEPGTKIECESAEKPKKDCFNIKEPGTWDREDDKYDVKDGTYSYTDENGEEQITSVINGMVFHQDIKPGTELCLVSPIAEEDVEKYDPNKRIYLYLDINGKNTVVLDKPENIVNLEVNGRQKFTFKSYEIAPGSFDCEMVFFESDDPEGKQQGNNIEDPVEGTCPLTHSVTLVKAEGEETWIDLMLYYKNNGSRLESVKARLPDVAILRNITEGIVFDTEPIDDTELSDLAPNSSEYIELAKKRVNQIVARAKEAAAQETDPLKKAKIYENARKEIESLKKNRDNHYD